MCFDLSSERLRSVLFHVVKNEKNDNHRPQYFLAVVVVVVVVDYDDGDRSQDLRGGRDDTGDGPTGQSGRVFRHAHWVVGRGFQLPERPVTHPLFESPLSLSLYCVCV